MLLVEPGHIGLVQHQGQGRRFIVRGGDADGKGMRARARGEVGPALCGIEAINTGITGIVNIAHEGKGEMRRPRRGNAAGDGEENVAKERAVNAVSTVKDGTGIRNTDTDIATTGITAIRTAIGEGAKDHRREAQGGAVPQGGPNHTRRDSCSVFLGSGQPGSGLRY